jgi:hypothetical protein
MTRRMLPFFGGRMPRCSTVLSGESIFAGDSPVRHTFTAR